MTDNARTKSIPATAGKFIDRCFGNATLCFNYKPSFTCPVKSLLQDHWIMLSHIVQDSTLVTPLETQQFLVWLDKLPSQLG